MIVERGARPDAPPKPKRSKTALIALLVGVAVGLALGLGLGIGLGANLNAVGVLNAGRLACATPPLSARARFLACVFNGPRRREAALGHNELKRPILLLVRISA